MKKISLFSLFIALSISLFSQNVCLTPLEKEVIDLLNQKRAENGLSQVVISEVLMLTANKNVEEIVTQSYLNYKPEKFGDYSAHFEQIRYSSSASTAKAIVQSLSFQSQYTNYHKIILNMDEMKSYNWKSAGICIREKNIVIIFGEKEVPAKEYPVCDEEKFFGAEELPEFPTFLVYIPEDAIVKIKALTFMGETIDYELNAMSSYVDKGTYLSIPLDEPSVATFTLYFRPENASIVPTEPIVFSVGGNEKGEINGKVEFTGNSIEEIKAYLATGVDINSVQSNDENAYSMLHRAVMLDNMEAVKFLMDSGADVNFLSSDKDFAIGFSRSNEMFDYLMTFNPELRVPNTDKITILHAFALHGLLEPIKYLVEKENFDLDAQERNGGTPLTYAIQNNRYDVAKYLLEKGAKQLYGWMVYPIHDACDSGNLEMVKLMVKYGADVNAKDGSGNTPLYHARIHADENTEIIDYLIGLGAK